MITQASAQELQCARDRLKAYKQATGATNTHIAKNIDVSISFVGAFLKERLNFSRETIDRLDSFLKQFNF